MNEILVDFQSESKDLIAQLMQILESVEADPSLYQSLEQYGQIVDRIMGAAKSMNEMVGRSEKLEAIGNFAALGKVIGYKASQVRDNEQLITVAVALLLDATELLNEINDRLLDDAYKGENLLSETFLDRLKWLATKFDESLRATVALDKSNSFTPGDTPAAMKEIEAVLKKMGMKSK